MKHVNPFLVGTILSAFMTLHAQSASSKPPTFGDDLSFLKQHTDVLVLKDAAGAAQVVVAPAWQGRVMTSSAEGLSGSSFGWINRELISSGKLQPHINVFGGEDRFWLGPEGGQFSIFFAKGASFDLEHWFTPAAIDTLRYQVVRQGDSSVAFRAKFGLTNYSGTRFEVDVHREVKLLTPEEAWHRLGARPEFGVKFVAYESANSITNAGNTAWNKSTGLLSVWILGMYNPAERITIVVPIKSGPASELGREVTSDYFGVVPSDRLQVKDGVIYFSGDGKFRSKIGINPRRSKSVLGSYDDANHTLTVVQFTQPEGNTEYVNSLWKLQDAPYSGDAANSYNDGPASPGAKPLGPFYELESSSPAAALDPGAGLTHVHRTFHITGDEAKLDVLAKHVFGVSLEKIKAALPHSH